MAVVRATNGNKRNLDSICGTLHGMFGHALESGKRTFLNWVVKKNHGVRCAHVVFVAQNLAQETTAALLDRRETEVCRCGRMLLAWIVTALGVERGSVTSSACANVCWLSCGP